MTINLETLTCMLLISCGERVPLVFLGLFVCFCKREQRLLTYHNIFTIHLQYVIIVHGDSHDFYVSTCLAHSLSQSLSASSARPTPSKTRKQVLVSLGPRVAEPVPWSGKMLRHPLTTLQFTSISWSESGRSRDPSSHSSHTLLTLSQTPATTASYGNSMLLVGC